MLTVPQLVIFDLDGTLIDTIGCITAAVNEVRAKHGLPALPASSVQTYTGGSPRVLLSRVLAETGRSDSEEWLTAAAEDYRQSYIRIKEPGVLYPGAGAVLQAHKTAGVPVALCTNKDGALVAEALKGTGLDGYFSLDRVVAAGGQHAPKPAPDGICWLCRQERVAPARTWMVGDGEMDMQAGRAAGCTTIACSYGHGRAADCEPDAVIVSPCDLVRLLQQTDPDSTGR
jgi:phosphoglycolate phosphatase